MQTPKIAEANDFCDIEFICPRTITDDKPSEKEINTTIYDRLRLEEKKVLLYLLDNEKIKRKETVKL